MLINVFIIGNNCSNCCRVKALEKIDNDPLNNKEDWRCKYCGFVEKRDKTEPGGGGCGDGGD